MEDKSDTIEEEAEDGYEEGSRRLEVETKEEAWDMSDSTKQVDMEEEEEEEEEEDSGNCNAFEEVKVEDKSRGIELFLVCEVEDDRMVKEDDLCEPTGVKTECIFENG